ncbi:hypothetical protein PUNSTDRAFT_49592 [Punctularia strigosozonata HHB-11173 SS5]|uniref:uncharacterized protein n=1 Tax=Punctularia strigosozonata (strain HHB-11173) TaxID=741275 RepID=UPI0004416A1C|nr:uncharacterized protein PUNSTDRAFT_49592 [Punctularia strigosozonata HHB-11173 SS5]EIN12329.1 hypothetical protein PUNSTDRAFT_49592 [Punctularia strigosozonata HHB-11173 SS5]
MAAIFTRNSRQSGHYRQASFVEGEGMQFALFLVFRLWLLQIRARATGLRLAMSGRGFLFREALNITERVVTLSLAIAFRNSFHEPCRFVCIAYPA